MAGLPAWIGWPGTGPAPGHDWLPSPVLRFLILLLAYAFLALALTVDYAASVAFFLLAISGMYVGLRRGFINGLTLGEKLVMVAFAAYPTVAIISYLFGTQTNVGFRFLGRDLRFLLFVPVYLAVRWSQPKRIHVGIALAGAAVGACIVAALQKRPWPAPLPHGVMGTHITFGDISILSGFVGAVLLIPVSRIRWKRSRGQLVRWGTAFVAVATGLAAGILSRARGGWIAVPALALLLVWLLPSMRRISVAIRIVATFLVLLAILGGAWLAPGVRHRLILAKQNAMAYLIVANASMIEAPCVDRKSFLSALLMKSHRIGPGTVSIVRLAAADREHVARFGCTGTYAVMLENPKGHIRNLEIRLYRGNGPVRQTTQTATILARGDGSFNVGWKAPWARISAPTNWEQYRATKSYNGVSSANIAVRPGGKLVFVPVQFPAGIFAYALARSSVGERLEMWRAAWAMFMQHPVLGTGTGSFRALGGRALGSSAVVRIAGDYQHAHSDYLTGLATKGVLGFLTFLGIVTSPCFALFKLGRGTVERWPVLASILIAVGFAIFALTETLFVHSSMISWFTTTSAVLLAVEAPAGTAERILPRGWDSE